MTEQELEQIEARANAATPGPWTGDRNDGTIKYRMMGGLDGQTEVLIVDHKNNSSGFYGIDDIPFEESEANEEFVKHARQDVPALLAEVERLNETIEKLAFVVEDETGMLSDAPLTPEKLEDILHTLKGQRDYAAESFAMLETENARLNKLVAVAKLLLVDGKPIDGLDEVDFAEKHGLGREYYDGESWSVVFHRLEGGAQ